MIYQLQEAMMLLRQKRAAAACALIGHEPRWEDFAKNDGRGIRNVQLADAPAPRCHRCRRWLHL